MGWWIAFGALAVALAVTLCGWALVRGSRRRRAARGWAKWRADQRSGAVAWGLFRRRPRVLRLEDRREQ